MNLDLRNRVHLNWMFDNQPDLVRSLHQQGKLEAHLEDKNQQGLALADKFKKEQGMSEDQAFEAAGQFVLAPANGPAMSDNPPEPVPPRERERIMDSLEKSKT